DVELERRQAGYGSGGRMQIERDQVRITSGVMNGLTTGAPIALTVDNRDFKNWKEKNIAPITTPRPGHADLTGALKYGYRELRLSLERASARETTMRVAVGAVCRKFLAQFGISIGGYVVQIGAVKAILDETPDHHDLYTRAEASDVRCPFPDVAEAMHEAIRQAKIEKDTLGGIFVAYATGVPVGLGSHVHWDRRLDARIMAAMVSIQAMKGASNRAGGLEGGITTGDPIVVRVAMKPIATMLRGAESVNLATGEPELTTYERSDFCAVPRAVPIGEAMLAYVVAEALLEKLGGDSLDEMRPRYEKLRQNRLSDVPMDNVDWRFGFE
nr:chorismate synthase [Anaerolineae bacterium]